MAKSDRPAFWKRLSQRRSANKFPKPGQVTGSAGSDSTIVESDPSREAKFEDSIKALARVIRSSLRPLPTQTGDGTYLTEEKQQGIIADIGHVRIKDIKTLADVLHNTVAREPLDDSTLLMERVIQLACGLPLNSKDGLTVTDAFLNLLWNDIRHPPMSYLGNAYAFRQADGSFNNVLLPQLGAAGSAYARTVRPALNRPKALPDPGVIFDSVLARTDYKEHPSKISSMLFYLASIIIHDLFLTDRKDYTKTNTSSYLELSPLYGNNQEEQNQIRTFKDGKLKPDCFSEKRVLGFPPGVGVFLIMFNRFHNEVVENLAAINEEGRFTKPSDTSDTAAMAAYDNLLFQTGRLVTCGLYINIVLKDYVRTILALNRTDNSWDLDPRTEVGNSLFGQRVAESGGNQVSAEFNLIYRWHSCISARDDKWSQDLYAELFPGQDPATVPLPELLQRLGRWEASMPADPQQRPFAKLTRQSDGTFAESSLVEILTDSIEDCAGAFGAKNVPVIMRAVEILGMQQARKWRVATLNELRKYFNLVPHKTFEDINPDPDVAAKLKHLYDHPDFVEMYPGVVLEKTKPEMFPGSGLCTNFTTSRAILSDAVALVRSDRFYTTDYVPQNLTNWGYNEASYDLSVDHGHVMYKLILRAFPNSFEQNSVYAHFPFVTPAENHNIFVSLKKTEEYSWARPETKEPPQPIVSYAACKRIMEDRENFKVTWGKAIEFLMRRGEDNYGRTFMLSGDSQPNLKSRQLMQPALYPEAWTKQVKDVHEQMMTTYLQKNSYKLTKANQIDAVRDLGNIVSVTFAAGVFALPIKTEDNPRGIFSQVELYDILAAIFALIFYDTDPAKSFPLHQASRQTAQQLGELVLKNVDFVRNTGSFAGLLQHFNRHDHLQKYGEHMIQELLKSGRDAEDIVWNNMLPTAGGMVATQGQVFGQVLDFYLSDENRSHLEELQRLARKDTPEADELIKRYMLEAARLRSIVGVYRQVPNGAEIDDAGKTVVVKPGGIVACNLVTASHDPATFPNPNEVILDRPIDSYIHYGMGSHHCLGYGTSTIGLTAMLKMMCKLPNLRRAPGAQGQLVKIPAPGGFVKYMSADQSMYTPLPMNLKVQWDDEPESQ